MQGSHIFSHLVHNHSTYSVPEPIPPPSLGEGRRNPKGLPNPNNAPGERTSLDVKRYRDGFGKPSRIIVGHSVPRIGDGEYLDAVLW